MLFRSTRRGTTQFVRRHQCKPAAGDDPGYALAQKRSRVPGNHFFGFPDGVASEGARRVTIFRHAGPATSGGSAPKWAGTQGNERQADWSMGFDRCDGRLSRSVTTERHAMSCPTCSAIDPRHRRATRHRARCGLPGFRPNSTRARSRRAGRTAVGGMQTRPPPPHARHVSSPARSVDTSHETHEKPFAGEAERGSFPLGFGSPVRRGQLRAPPSRRC